MEPHPFVAQLATVHQRAAALLERAQEVAPHSLRDWTVAEPSQAEVLKQIWHELTRTMAELLTVHDAFQAQRPRHRDLLEFAPDGYLVTDSLGLIREANEAAAQLFAVPQSGLVGMRLADLVAPDDLPGFEESLSELATTLESKHRETRLLSRQGKVLEVAYVVVPGHDTRGGVARLRWLIWDIAERKRQDELLQASRRAAEQAAERASRLQAVIGGLSEAANPNQVLAAIVQHGATALGAAAGVLNLLSGDGTRLTSIGIGHPERVLEPYREFPLSAARPGADVLRSGEPLWIGSHQEFSDRYPDLAKAGPSGGVESMVVIPLLVDQRPLGALAISYENRREFTPEDQTFLLALAHLSAQALGRQQVLQAENVTLREVMSERAEHQAQSAQALEQLHTYTADLEQAREEERRRMALELHDQLGGALTALKMDVYLLRSALGDREAKVSSRLGAMSEALTGSIALVRNIASELRPPMLDDLGLPAALEWAAEEFQTRFAIPCRWISNSHPVTLDPLRATAIFRVVQECLTNVVRHAQATQVTVSLLAKPDGLTVQVSDDGRGFRYSPASRTHSVGLAGIHERVRAIGGDLHIETAPGEGTVVRLWVGWSPTAPGQATGATRARR